VSGKDKLTKGQITELAQRLSHPWGAVTLHCDDDEVALCVERFKPMVFRVMTYVNGVFKAAWCLPSTQAREAKYLRRSVRPNVSPAKRAKLEKEFGKRAIARDKYFSGSVTIFLPDWPSGKAVLQHLNKVANKITVAERPTLAGLTKELNIPLTGDGAGHEQAAA
jgi:hypothetical protein